MNLTDAGMSESVSIHATLAGGDFMALWNEYVKGRKVSIHATLAGGDTDETTSPPVILAFLSTPPSRVATRPGQRQSIPLGVSIHATLAGGDPFVEGRWFVFYSSFYPRHPRGWRRFAVASRPFFGVVSIHATLAGGDNVQPSQPAFCIRFYPRHPRGWRPFMCVPLLL